MFYLDLASSLTNEGLYQAYVIVESVAAKVPIHGLLDFRIQRAGWCHVTFAVMIGDHVTCLLFYRKLWRLFSQEQLSRSVLWSLELWAVTQPEECECRSDLLPERGQAWHPHSHSEKLHDGHKAHLRVRAHDAARLKDHRRRGKKRLFANCILLINYWILYLS